MDRDRTYVILHMLLIFTWKTVRNGKDEAGHLVFMMWEYLYTTENTCIIAIKKSINALSIYKAIILQYAQPIS